MLTVIEKVLLIQDLRLFRFALTEHLARLALICQDAEVTGNEILFKEGESGSPLHLLVNGRVMLQISGEEASTVDRGDLDSWSFFAGTPHLFTGITLEDSTLLTVPYGEMADLLMAEPEFCWAITQHLAQLGRQNAAAFWKEKTNQG